MAKHLSLFSLILIFGVLSCTKGSKIPERREFPLDAKVNPCNDMYAYACNKVTESFELPEDRARWAFAFSDSAERLLEKKKKYFAELSSLNPSGKREKALKNFFVACMNESGSRAGEKAYVEEISSELDGLKTREALLDYFAAKIPTGEMGVLSFGTISNHDKPEFQDLYLDIPLQSLPERTYYEKKELTDDLKKLMTRFYTLMGEKEPAKVAEKTYAFEKELAQVYPLPVEVRTLVAQRTGVTKKQLREKYPHFKVDQFLKRIPDHTHIRSFMPKAMALLNAKLGSMPLEDLKNLYKYFALKEIMDDAYPEFFKEKFAMEAKHLGGAPKRPDREERCTKKVMAKFGKELDSVLLPRIFPDFPTEDFKKLAERVRGSLLTALEKNKWLSEKSRKAAIEKIQTARLQLVKPETEEEWDFNPEAEYSPTNPVQNSIKLSGLLTQKELDELKGPISKDRWEMSPLTVNAYYHPAYNKFVMPIAILQFPFFDPALSDAQNLAAVGTVIGHELGHGIDDKGAKYDSKGKLRQWLSDADLKKLAARSKPLVEQFNKIGHNGELTLGENIGDLVGLSASYRAAFPDAEKDYPKQDKKDFFLQYAKVWCEVQTPSRRDLRLKTDPHSLGVARVNEQMKHQAGFQEAFDCKPGDALYLEPKERVSIWN